VPAGYTAVVREMDVYTGLGASEFALNIQDSDEAPLLTLAAIKTAGLAQSAQWQGRGVVSAGGTISIYQFTLGVEATCYVGGYLLTGVFPG
jgi:hypothetical protein